MNVRLPNIARCGGRGGGRGGGGGFGSTIDAIAGPITTLPMDASDLRRELYRRLAHLDAAQVGSMTDHIARGTAVIDEGAR